MPRLPARPRLRTVGQYDIARWPKFKRGGSKDGKFVKLPSVLQRSPFRRYHLMANLNTVFRQVLPAGSGLTLKQTRDQLFFKYGYYLPANPANRTVNPARGMARFKREAFVEETNKSVHESGDPTIQNWPDQRVFLNDNKIVMADMYELHKQMLLKLRNEFPTKHVSLCLVNEGALMGSNAITALGLLSPLVKNDEKARNTVLKRAHRMANDGRFKRHWFPKPGQKADDIFEPMRDWLWQACFGGKGYGDGGRNKHMKGGAERRDLLDFAMSMAFCQNRRLVHITIQEYCKGCPRKIQTVVIAMAAIRRQVGLSWRGPENFANNFDRVKAIRGMPAKIESRMYNRIIFKLLYN